MSHHIVKISTSLPPEPAMSQAYFNAKYKAWLKRRGFDQEADEMKQRAFLNRKRRGIKSEAEEAKP